MEGYRTYISLFVAVLPSILGLFGYHLVTGSTDQITTLINDFITIIASGAAFYFRAKASVPGFLVKNQA